ncbi:MAG: carbohydrate ABC transporter permease, partial [Egibacteraceae bacterium]
MAVVYEPTSTPWSRRARSAGYYLVVAAVMLPFLFVFYYMITTSLKSQLAITAPDFQWLFVPTLDNYRAV